jgi:D-glycero-alpha-D-manno-heptose-7-phosphate kinase
MIIVRSPLRISLGGGGTDLPSYYSKKSGFVISAAINKYVYVTITRPFRPGVYLKYSSIEKISHIDKIKHPIIRETLREEKLFNKSLEITTLADIPSGTGLGSSGSFTTALIKAIYFDQKKIISGKKLAEKACKIEIDILNEPSGKQDQYISSYGGVNSFKFQKNGDVKIEPLKISEINLSKLESNLLLFYTGFTRESKKILITQAKGSINTNSGMIKKLDKIKEIGIKISSLLKEGNFEEFAEIMNEHWMQKKKRSNLMSNTKIDSLYEGGLKNGALGGKLVGAGGGGFLMFYANDKEKLKNYFMKRNIEEVEFKFEFEGSKIIME